jgi:hypothetical protein
LDAIVERIRAKEEERRSRRAFLARSKKARAVIALAQQKVKR